MHYRHAGHIVFWVVVLVTLFWALYGRLDVAGVVFLTGLVFVEEAFVAARAEETTPFVGRLHLGALDAQIIATPKSGPFERLEWEADFKDVQPPFVLRATVKKTVKTHRIDRHRLKTKLAHINDLQELDVDGKTVTLLFRDQPGKTPGSKNALAWLEKALR